MKKLLSLLTLLALSTSTYAELSLRDTHGNNTPISELKGKWVVINYWASWCATCVEEIPELNRFYSSHLKDPVALYAVNYDAPPLSEQQSVIKKLNINYPSLISNPARAYRLGGITGVPMTFIINPKGKLVKTLYGGQTVKSLNKAIAS